VDSTASRVWRCVEIHVDLCASDIYEFKGHDSYMSHERWLESYVSLIRWMCVRAQQILLYTPSPLRLLQFLRVFANFDCF